MKLEIKKFLSSEDIASLLEGHAGLLHAKVHPVSWDFIFRHLKEWKSGGARLDQAIRLKEFFDFLNMALPLASRGELDFLRGLFEEEGEEACGFKARLRARVEAGIARELKDGPPQWRGKKIRLDLLMSYGERIEARLENLKAARDKGKSDLLQLKEAIRSCSNDSGKKSKASKYKKQFIALGEKVLRACDLVFEKTREKSAIEEIRGIHEKIEKTLLEKGINIRQEFSPLEGEISKIDERFSRMEPIWEKLSEVLVKISMEEKRLERAREALVQKRENNKRYIKKVEDFKERISRWGRESSEIDETLRRLPEAPILVPQCKERISKNREAMLVERKNAGKLLKAFKAIREKQDHQLEEYQALLNTLLDLQAEKSFYFITLSKIARSNRSKIEAASNKSLKALLGLAGALVAMDRFIVENLRLSQQLEQDLSALEKMEGLLKKSRKDALKWEGTLKHFKEKDLLYVPVKPVTLLEAAGKDADFDRCLSPLADRKTISLLLDRNYDQEKEVGDFELANLSKVIFSEAPARTTEALASESDSGQAPSPEEGKRSFLMLKILQWRKRRRRRMDKARRLDYPQTGKPPLSRRVLAVLIPMMGLGYYSNPVAHVDESKIVDDLKNEPLLQELYREEQPQTDLQLDKIIHALMYGPERATASPDVKLDQKKQWEIFTPVFENFSLHWANGNSGPILINKNGRAPGAQSSEAFKLFEEIKKRMDPEYSGFFSRLYLNLMDLGAAPKEAAKFIIAMETSSPAFPRDKGVKTFYEGQNLPISELEEMNFKEFVKSISPYIVEKYSIFSKSLGMQIPDDLPEYARMLSEDIFHCARILGVPLTSMVTIAHHETYFMNIFGDGSRSVGPFQLFEPTRELIENDLKDAGLKMRGRIRRLEDHITLSTFMATFHFATLMKRFAYFEKDPSGEKIKRIVVDLDKSLKLYNGHATYPHKVFQKSRLLKYYLSARKDVYARASNFLM